MAPKVRVGVREVRQNLSVYLDRVKAGEVLEITEHGHPVALLGPGTGAPRDALARLVAEGRARGPRVSREELTPPVRLRPAPGGPTMAEILAGLRQDRV